MTMIICSLYPDSLSACRHQFQKGWLPPRPNMSATNGQGRSEQELRDMLHEAEERKQLWEEHFKSAKMDRKSNAEAIRNITALRGVIKTLRWALNMTDRNGLPIPHPLD